MPGTNHVSRVCNVAAMLWLQNSYGARIFFKSFATNCVRSAQNSCVLLCLPYCCFYHHHHHHHQQHLIHFLGCEEAYYVLLFWQGLLFLSCIKSYIKWQFFIELSQRPCGLRHESTATRLLGLRVRIPPRARMSVSCECCVLPCRGLCVRLITRLEESYPVWRVWV